MIARDQTFNDMRIVVDGCAFYNCTFRSCVFIYCASLPVVMENNRFDRNCRWEFDRAAKSTMDFLATMYRAGATQLVENTFDAIRGVRPQGTHLM
jgi:hypothetical protein